MGPENSKVGTKLLTQEFPESSQPTLGVSRQALFYAATAYLVLPLFLFLLDWVRPAWGWSLGLLLGIACVLSVRNAQKFLKQRSEPGGGIGWITAGGLLLVSVGWCLLSGAGDLVFVNRDWMVRGSVLWDIASTTGPVVYRLTDTDTTWLLRCPLAFYLPPAMAGRLVGSEYLSALTCGWMSLGVFLFLALIWERSSSRWAGWVAVAIAVGFSGMDWIGGWLQNAQPELIAESHLEWWAGPGWQYSSMTTQLFWVPLHAFPSWLIVAMMLSRLKSGQLTPLLAVALCALPLWSPFAVLGCLPFIGLYCWQHLKSRRQWFDMALPGLLALPATLLSVQYITLAADSLEFHSEAAASRVLGPYEELGIVLGFWLLEAGLLWMLVWSRRRGWWLGMAAAVLLALPWLHFGPNNDLVMRASIPALLVICVGAADVLFSEFRSKVAGIAVRAAIVLVLLLGVVTPFHEVLRALWRPAGALVTKKPSFIITRGAPHYFANISEEGHPSWLAEHEESEVTLKPPKRQGRRGRAGR